MLRPLIAFFAIACVVFVSCAELKAPLWLLMITGCLAGSSMPSLGSMVRARWSALLPDPAALQSAFALESVVDEMVFVIGPALVTVLATALPPAGVLLCMVLAVTGTLFFAAQRQTEPPVRPRRTVGSSQGLANRPGQYGANPRPEAASSAGSLPPACSRWPRCISSSAPCSPPST